MINCTILSLLASGTRRRSSNSVASNERGKEKKMNGPPPQPSLPAVRHAIVALIARPPPQRCPHCRKQICASTQRE